MFYDLIYILPDIYLSFVSVIVLVMGSFLEKSYNKVVVSVMMYLISLSIFIVLFFLILFLFPIYDYAFLNNLFGVSSFCIAFKLLITFLIIILLMYSYRFMVYNRYYVYEYFVLIMFSVLGLFFLLLGMDLIVFYLSIELMSLSFYVLSGSSRFSEFSTEAGLKYFILGALSSGLLLFGFSLIYGFLGTTNYLDISVVIDNSFPRDLRFLMGILFVLIAVLFKLALAPFHVWVPDVYEGSPTVVTFFYSLVPKLAIFALLIKLYFYLFGSFFVWFEIVLILSCVFSVFLGAIGAFNQSKLKRLFAYSAIGHGGYVLLGFLVNSYLRICSMIIYLVFYVIMVINVFTLVLSLNKKLSFYSIHYVLELMGSTVSAGVISWSFILCLFSMAGVPPLLGFLSKFVIFYQGVSSGLYLYCAALFMFSVLGAFYYVRLVRYIVFKERNIYFHKVMMDVLDPYIRISYSKSLVLGLSLWLILTLIFFSNVFFELPLYLVFTV